MNYSLLSIKSGSFLLPAYIAVLLITSCSYRPHTLSTAAVNKLPPVILWAWERPENLEFLDPERYGVAFLSQTLILKDDDVVFRPRRQPLKVGPKAQLIAVTRIESIKTTGTRAALSDNQKAKLVSLILKTLELDKVVAVQIDFDAASSEREFYGSLLKDLRAQIPVKYPLSMTALASFCIGDRWLEDVPVDEVVPMIFRMGIDDKPIKNSLSLGNDFREPLCRHSYGVALDEPLDMKMDSTRRLYVFSDHSWTEKDLSSLPEEFRK
ncbi:MAG TPA: hypothetical protein VGN86_10720 [Pyrinomonadaceae bacterium]|jgi:hypothetical protein|nr:hypothetical protein [Pyrinomonadaceae bacterium]